MAARVSQGCSSGVGKLVIRQATWRDVDQIVGLLQENHLRTEGILDARTCYWVAEGQSGVIGAVGLELGDGCALLRSAIVAAPCRGYGIGRSLTEAALAWAWGTGYRAVYCFSTDAGAYWTQRGFSHCPVEEVVRALRDAPQVRLFDSLGWLPTEVAYRIAPS